MKLSLKNPAYLLGSGLVTRLGSGLPAHASALKQLRASPGRTPPNANDSENRSWPYHLIEGIEGRERLNTLLQLSIEQALKESELDSGQVRRLALFVGSTCLDLPLHESAYAEAAAAGPSHIPIQGPGYGNVASWIAERFGIEGPQYTLNTACSSSANALLHARLLLKEGLVEHALVIGVEAFNRLSVLGFGSLLLLSKQDYRPFDKNRDGLILGEGAGVMLLGREPRSGETPGLALCGAASACDPSSPTNSLPERVAGVMRAALDDTGTTLDRLIAIKAHGTGTTSNDLSEGQGLRLLGEHLRKGGLPPFTSLKPYTGHTMGGCGVIESLCLLAAWSEGFLPGTPGFTETDPDIGLSPITAATPLPPQGAVLCNFFGFGGNNTSLVFARA